LSRISKLKLKKIQNPVNGPCPDGVSFFSSFPLLFDNHSVSGL
jgi:hypothetical protein